MTNHQRFTLLFASLLSIAFAACNSSEIGKSKDVNQETIYQHYSIDYDQSKPENVGIEVTAQYRFAGNNGTTLVLDAPSNVAFDGQQINVDSNTVEGAYYQLQLPVANFFQSHTFLFTDFAGKQYSNRFEMKRFQLSQIPSGAVKDRPLVLRFDHALLSADDFIEVNTVNTDSSFSLALKAGEGNELIIPARELKRQKGHELTLEINQYQHVSVKESAKEGGDIELTQRLKPITIPLIEHAPTSMAAQARMISDFL